MNTIFTEQLLDEGHRRFIEKEGRSSFYEMATNLLSKGFVTEGRLLLLEGWDGALFSKKAKNFSRMEFEDAFKVVRSFFDRLRYERFEDVNIQDIEENAGNIYSILSEVETIKYTGATKLMSLEIPPLFVMWDSRIRKQYGIHATVPEPQDYVLFLRLMKEATQDVQWNPSLHDGIPLAKAIDEYNYVTITLGII